MEKPHIASGSYNIFGLRWLSSHAWVLFLIWSIWLALPFFGLGPYSYIPVQDTGNIILPGKLAVASLLSEGKIGYWFPRVVAGLDMLASGTGYAAQLDSVPFFFLPGWLAFGLIMVLQRFVAGYFTYRLFKESLNLSASVSLFAGAAYAIYFPFVEYDGRLGGFALYDGLGLPGLPFILWALTRLDERPGYLAFLGSAALGLLLSLNYFYVYSVFLFPVVIFWFIFITPKKRPVFWGMILLFCLAWLLGEVPVLWASLLNAPLSGRGEWDPYKIYSLRSYAINAWIQLKLHFMPLCFAFMGLIFSKERDRRLKPLLSAIFLSLVCYAAYPLVLRLAAGYMGPLRGFNLIRFHQMIPFLGIVSAGIGLHLIGCRWRLSLVRNKTSFIDISAEKVLVAYAIIFIIFQSLSANWKMLNGIAEGKNFAAFYRHPGLQQLAEKQRLLPPFRVATVFNIHLYLQEPNFPLAYGLETVDGFVSLYSKRYQDFWREVIRPLTRVNKGILDVFDYKARGRLVYLFSAAAGGHPLKEHPLSFEDNYDLELLSLLNLRYIISPVPLQEGNLALSFSNANEKQAAWKLKGRRSRMIGILRGESPGISLYIYENLRALPRFFLVGNAVLFDGPSQVLAAMREADFESLRDTAYLNRADASGVALDSLSKKDGKVNLISYSADKITLEVESKGCSLLIVTNNFSPYWKAKVDGVNAAVLPADHTFQAVYIEPGRHHVVLAYKPPYAIRFRD